jgi:threonine dehydrogenase-like Zn-dependent dehydrogenase
MSRLDDWRPLGYSTAGRILEVGERVTDLLAGDLVACAGAGYANHAEIIAVPRNLVATIPSGVDPRQAAFATLGAIALQGIHRANLTPGESVGVIGLGLLGQLTALILKQYNMPVR